MTTRQARSFRFDAEGPTTQIHWCPVFSPGSLGVRVYPNAANVFVARTKVRGKTRIRKIGAVAEFTKMAEVYAATRAVLVGLIGEREITVEDIANDYLRYFERKGKSATAKYHVKTRLKRDILPTLGKRKACSITKAEIIDFHAEISARAPYEANRMVQLLKAMYNIALEMARLPPTFANPAAVQAKFLNIEHSRDRRVEEHEIGALLDAIHAEENPYIRALFLLLMHTGMRLHTEALALTWSQVDLKARMIRLPDPKNRQPHRIPLTDDAVTILSGLPRLRGCEWVFPGRNPAKPLNNPYKPWRKILQRAGITGLKPHDLRRSYASWMINDGISLEVVGQMLNHKSIQTTRKVYAQVSDESAREAADKLSKVVPLSRRAVR
jgi:integrase